jgi:hypothetical protein
MSFFCLYSTKDTEKHKLCHFSTLSSRFFVNLFLQSASSRMLSVKNAYWLLAVRASVIYNTCACGEPFHPLVRHLVCGTLLLFSTTHCSLLRLIVRSRLDVPTFAIRRLHACHHARAPSDGRWNCGREMSGNFA